MTPPIGGILRLSGHVIGRQSRQGLAGLLVEFRAGTALQPIATATTAADGAFELQFGDVALAAIPLSAAAPPPEFSIRVVSGQTAVATAKITDLPRPGVAAGPLTIEVDQDPATVAAALLNTVQGEVRDGLGTPVAGVTVIAFAKLLRSEAAVGSFTTTAAGTYSIAYPAATLHPAGLVAGALVVRAFDPAGKQIASSPLVFNPRPIETVNLAVGGAEFRPASEFENLRAGILPLVGSVGLVDLKPDELLQVVGGANVDPDRLGLLATANNLSKAAGLPPEALYALFRQGYPASLAALAAQPADAVRQALQQAVTDNVVPGVLGAQIDKFVALLPKLAASKTFLDPTPGAKSLAPLMQLTKLQPAQQVEVLSLFAAAQVPLDQLWQQLRARTDLNSAGQIDQLQLTLQLGTIAQNHAPMVQALQQTPIKSVRDLVGLTADDWLKLTKTQIAGKVVGVPPGVPGKDADAKALNYARTAAAIVELAFPTPVLADRISKDAAFPLKNRSGVVQFFQKNPDFELSTDQIDALLKQNPGALTGVTNPDGTVADLKRLQRVFRATPGAGKVDVAKALLADGVTSAFAIARFGRNAFVQTYAPKLGEARSAQMYANASDRAAVAMSVFARAGNPMNSVSLYGAGGGPQELDAVPDLRTLFGPLEMCECEECRSVYSPAAYLVDILHFLELRVTGGKKAITALFERRPDLGAIELNCDNTNVPLPYVDLVNEILENTIAPGPPVPQTGDTAEQLRTHPEHLNEAAYDTLIAAVYPWILPYHLWASEARKYLAHLGVPRYQLMETLRRTGAQPDNNAVAAEELEMSPLERQIVTGGLAGHQPQEFWGLTGADWVTKLGQVPAFLAQSDLLYTDLLELLDARYINPTGAIQVNFPQPDCDLTTATIAGLSDVVLGRIHRFARLKRRLGWKAYDLDAAVSALPPHDLTDVFLVSLSEIERLQGLIRKTPLLTMLAWWAKIDTVTRGEQPSLYETVFLNKTFTRPGETAFERLRLNAAGTELASASNVPAPTIKDNAAAVLAALGLREDELEILHGALLSNDLLNLVNLSALYRGSTFARALKLSITDLATLLNLSGINPFNPADVAATRRFAETAKIVAASGFKLEQLNYILRHRAQPTSPFAPGDDQIAQFLDQIRNAVQYVAAQLQFAQDPDGTLTAQNLGLVMDTLPVSQAMVLLTQTGVRTAQQATDQNLFIDTMLAPFLDATDAKAKLVGAPPAPPALTAKQQRFEYLLTRLLAFLVRNQSENAVIQAASDAFSIVPETARLLLQQLVPSQASATNKAIADFLALASVPAETTITPAAFPVQFRQYRLLHKIGTLLKKLKIATEQVVQLFSAGPSLGWLDPNQLPLAEVTDAAAHALFQSWLRMARASRLEQDLPPGEPALLDILLIPADGTKTAADYRAAVEARTGWSDEDLQFLMGAQGFAVAYPAGYSNLQSLERMDIFRQVFDMRKRIGIPAKTLFSWNAVTVTPAIAREIKQAVKSKYDQDAWLNVAKTIRDDLREQQRAALVAYTLAHPALLRPSLPQGSRGAVVKDLQQRLRALGSTIAADGVFGANTRTAVTQFQQANALTQSGIADTATWTALLRGERLADSTAIYDHLLIDPEMSACTMTSRIKQAICSVQLFIQRSFLNLEADVALLAGDADEWKWKKQYRVWEANRKIFLYPENWIEPELRDGKSPFFVDLENELLQGDVTDAAVDDAFIRYVESLDDVARLEVAASYQQIERDERGAVSIDVLHVFGRSRTEPPVYYYRQRVDSSYWTPWEKVDLDIQGSHIMPTVYNRRLYLMWAMFAEKADDSQPLPTDGGQKPDRFWEIRLAWSFYRNGRWAAKKISRTPLLSKYGPPATQIALEDHSFRVFEDAPTGDLIVRCVQNFMGTGIVGDFRLVGCSGEVVTVDLRIPGPGKPVNGEWTPLFTQMKNMEFTEFAEPFSVPLFLPVGQVSDDPSYEELADNTSDLRVLNTTQGTFRLLPPHQDHQFLSQRPFFYQDNDRSLFVTPSVTRRPIIVYDPGGSTTLSIGRDYADAVRKPDFLSPRMMDTVVYHVDGAYPNGMPLIGGPSTAFRAAATSTAPASGGRFGFSPGIQSQTATLMLQSGIGSNTQLSIGTPLYSLDTSLSGINLVQPVFYITTYHYQFQTFYHPYSCLIMKQLKRDGIDGLLKAPQPANSADQTLHRQLIEDDYFQATYSPVTPTVRTPFPIEDIDFSYTGAYSIYNWELFFHAPFLVANRLKLNRQFEAAQKWYHYIFDPTDTSDQPVPARFWKIKPFFQEAQGLSIQKLLLLLGQSSLTPEEQEDRRNLLAQIAAWTKDPFQPHVIARLRQLAYQKAIVMKYLDNLIAWGDDLFAHDTIEAINEATQLYILALQILGKRPEKVYPPKDAVPTIGGTPVKTYNDLAPHLDDFSNALTDLETLVPPLDDAGVGDNGAPGVDVLGPSLYFCVPKNDNLLRYWDTVEDRLFKIRNCMNLQGVVRQLALFEPPIDPGALVRAAAAGIDIGSLFLTVGSAIPPYRFDFISAKATEFNGDVRALGQMLLGMLQINDVTQLQDIQAGQAVALQQAMSDIYSNQIDMQQAALNGLQISKTISEYQRDTLRARKKYNEWETAQLVMIGVAKLAHLTAGILKGVAMSNHFIADLVIGAAGGFSSPVTLTVPPIGEKSAHASDAASGIIELAASLMDTAGQMSGLVGGYTRRKDEWDMQAEMADRQANALDQQIQAATIQLAVANKQKDIHDLQIQQAQDQQTFLSTRFTNQELYGWMLGQISAVYFQSYQLAVDMARKAEQCYQFEIGDYEASFISFGHFDNARKGLLAGDKLQVEIRQMQSAYVANNIREYEITKRISLAAIDANALTLLRTSGACTFIIPEIALDLDYPGHFFRRIKTVSMTVPAERDPNASFNCTLSYLSGSVRISNDPLPQYARDGEDALRFRDFTGPVQRIATSNGISDSGLFLVNFFDPRYLPFEFLGLVDSQWHLEIPAVSNGFRISSIVDILIDIKYTSREGGDVLRTAALANLNDVLDTTGLARFFSAKVDFGPSFGPFVGGNPLMPIDWSVPKFPAVFADRDITLTAATFFLSLKAGFTYDDAHPLRFNLSGPGGALFTAQQFLVAGSPIAGLPAVTVFTGSSRDPGIWTLSVTAAGTAHTATGTAPVHPGAIDDVWMVVHFTVS